MNKQDLMFLIWGAIWITWLAAFVTLYSWSWPITAMVFGVLFFLGLWWAFCRSLDSMANRS